MDLIKSDEKNEPKMLLSYISSETELEKHVKHGFKLENTELATFRDRFSGLKMPVFLLLCEVTLGNLYKTSNFDRRDSAPDGYDSLKFNGSNRPN